MKRIFTWPLSLFAVVGTILSASCWGTTPTTAVSEAVEMQVYEVPAGQSEQVRSILRSALGGENPIGRVTTGPGSTVVVVAPAQVHEGVRGLISGLDAVDTSADLLQMTISYWMIIGRPLEKAPAEGSYVVSGDSRLTAVESALEAIVGVQGPTEFRLLEQIQITALNSDTGTAQGRHAAVEQRISDIGGQITGDVSLRVGPNHLRTRVTLDPGQLLVMGQVGYRGGSVFESHGSADLTLYYVMARQP